MLRGMWKPADALPLKPAQRADLEALVRSGKTPQRVAARAAIVLATSGQPMNAIARAFGVSRPTVYLWRRRFEEAGVVGLVKDAPDLADARRSPRIRSARLSMPPCTPRHLTRRTGPYGPWPGADISHAIVHRIWRAHGLQPHRIKTFKLSRDPEFWKKDLRDVVGIYLPSARSRGGVLRR